MNVFYWILAVFLYLAIGAIIGGLAGFEDDPIGIMFGWPLYVVALILWCVFRPFVILANWIGEKRRRYRYKRKQKKAGYKK
jgi:hypothetical protein